MSSVAWGKASGGSRAGLGRAREGLGWVSGGSETAPKVPRKLRGSSPPVPRGAPAQPWGAARLFVCRLVLRQARLDCVRVELLERRRHQRRHGKLGVLPDGGEAARDKVPAPHTDVTQPRTRRKRRGCLRVCAETPLTAKPGQCRFQVDVNGRADAGSSQVASGGGAAADLG